MQVFELFDLDGDGFVQKAELKVQQPQGWFKLAGCGGVEHFAVGRD